MGSPMKSREWPSPPRNIPSPTNPPHDHTLSRPSPTSEFKSGGFRMDDDGARMAEKAIFSIDPPSSTLHNFVILRVRQRILASVRSRRAGTLSVRTPAQIPRRTREGLYRSRDRVWQADDVRCIDYEYGPSRLSCPDPWQSECE